MAGKVKKKKSEKSIFLAFLLTVVIAVSGYIILEKHHIFEREYDDNTLLNSSLKLTPDPSGNRSTTIPPSTKTDSSISSEKITPDSSDDRATTVPLSIEPDPHISIFLDKLNSPNAILIRLKDQTVLMQKNSEEKIYPASLTKMMTAIVAIENLSDLEEEIKLTQSTFQGLYEADASMAGFQPGEQVKAIDLLYGVLLPSGAECCVALADQIAGSEQNFVKLMNQKAEDLGMDNTHFENTTGLPNANHYTTVKDLAILLSYALKNDTFQEILTSSRHSTPPTNKHPNGITLYSTMYKELNKLNNQSIADGKILGGKTGYTDAAGLCLASLAQIVDQEYILITVGAKGNYNNVTDALAVYNCLGK